jgi:uncharacterized protein (TIGR03086 family)
MDTVASVEHALNEAHAMIASTSAADLEKPTPCTAWTVSALIEHMTGVVNQFAAGFTGTPLSPPPAPGTGGQTNRDVAGTYRQAVDDLLKAVRAPGALDKTLKLPFGEMPGGQALGIVIGDQSIHTWDLAKALGKPYTMDEQIASSVLTMMHQLMGANPGARGEGRGFAAEVPCPANAPVQDRLLAFSGRQP